jgi:hypothetical protein
MRKRPSKNVQTLLDFIQNRGDAIFWRSRGAAEVSRCALKRA